MKYFQIDIWNAFNSYIVYASDVHIITVLVKVNINKMHCICLYGFLVVKEIKSCSIMLVFCLAFSEDKEDRASDCRPLNLQLTPVDLYRSKPRFGKPIRGVNRVKRAMLCERLVAINDNFDNVIFSDKWSAQLHQNKTTKQKQNQNNT